MDNGKISVRYARALIATAFGQHCETEVYEQLTRLTDNYSLAIGQFNEALSNPLTAETEKLQLLRTAIGEPVHPCLDHFLKFIIEKKREKKIFLVALKYQELYRKEKNLLRADVTTAAKLDDKALESIKDYVQRTFNCDVEMHVKVDPTLIGGFTLNIENNILDGSIKGKLEKLRIKY